MYSLIHNSWKYNLENGADRFFLEKEKEMLEKLFEEDDIISIREYKEEDVYEYINSNIYEEFKKLEPKLKNSNGLLVVLKYNSMDSVYYGKETKCECFNLFNGLQKLCEYYGMTNDTYKEFMVFEEEFLDSRELMFMIGEEGDDDNFIIRSISRKNTENYFKLVAKGDVMINDILEISESLLQ